MTSQPLNSFLLQLTRQIGLRWLSRGIVSVLTTQIALDMVDIFLELGTRSTMHRVQVIILIVRLCRPFLQILDDTLQVLNTVFVGTHLIVAQVFRL